jgi:hypothetical protein
MSGRGNVRYRISKNKKQKNTPFATGVDAPPQLRHLPLSLSSGLLSSWHAVVCRGVYRVGGGDGGGRASRVLLLHNVSQVFGGLINLLFWAC